MPEYVGGTEFYTRWLAHGLGQRGHNVALFYRRSGQETALTQREDEDGVQVWAVTAGIVTPTARFLATFGQQDISNAFGQVLAQIRPDLVHIQHLLGLPVELAQQLQQLDIPYVITLHDYWWVCANAQLVTNYNHRLCNGPQGYLNCARCALARANRPTLWPALPGIAGMLAWRNYRLRQVMRAAQRLIAPTDFVHNWYARHGAPAEKVQVIPHGLPVPDLKPRPPRKTDRPLRFAYIGGLSWQKGVHVLLGAFSNLDMEQEPELLIAGDDTTDPVYMSQLRTLAPSSVQFLGKLTRTAVWELLEQVDVLVVPSLWYETFAFVVSEAMAAGVPVVASRLGPLADRVRHEIDGLLVPPGNVEALALALSRFQQEPSLLPRLQAGLQPVRTIEEYIDEIEGVYQAVLT